MSWKSLFYFDEVRRVERAAINVRRSLRTHNERSPIASNPNLVSPSLAEFEGAPTKSSSRRKDVEHFEPAAWRDGKALDASLSVTDILDIKLEAATRATAPDPERTRPEPEPCDANGLSLSGGGIRSAAFSLGVLQALNARKMLLDFDYLSTVSGGGYIGASLTAALNANKGSFPYATEDGDFRDSESVGHLRNYSNYLFPRNRSALRNWSDAIVILSRGILTNILVVTPFFMLAAMITAFAYSNSQAENLGLVSAAIQAALLRWEVVGPDMNLYVGVALVSFITLWAAVTHLGTSLSIKWTLVFTGVTLSIFSALMAALYSSEDVAAPIARTLGLLPIADANAVNSFGTRLGAFITMVAVSLRHGYGTSAFVLGTFLFLLAIWSVVRSNKRIGLNDAASFYLTLNRRLFFCLLVMAVLDTLPFAMRLLDAKTIETLLATIPGWTTTASLLLGTILIALLSDRLSAATGANARQAGVRASAIVMGSRAVLILASTILPIVGVLILIWLCREAADNYWFNQWRFWALTAGLLFFASLVRPNAHSLHQFYRDRLQAAFLSAGNYCGSVSTPLAFTGAPKLSQLNPLIGPYHLLNTALNLQGSREANQRGREADFFAFSSQFIGADLTLYTPTNSDFGGFISTSTVETEDVSLDLASVVAISGAAASANMGSNTVRSLTPTLAFLNVRLGYWLSNPRSPTNSWGTGFFKRPLEKLYLLREILGLLDEKSSKVYLTDGGHIENLGVYELLKRGCQLIVAVDAEADPAMAFPSLLKLERYARIDLGVTIDLPWERIARNNASSASHAVAGTIRYPGGVKGVMIYIKASLSGDERDYVTDYHARHPAFPHEATSDQFFTEEQFEVYRSLGFHATDRIFERKISLPCATKLWKGEAGDQHVFDLLRKHFPDGVFDDLHQGYSPRQTF